jgi:hypothetical protein
MRCLGAIILSRHGIRIKLWHSEYDFDKEDGKIVVPLILLLLGLALTQLRKYALFAGAVAYYLLYFFPQPVPSDT